MVEIANPTNYHHITRIGIQAFISMNDLISDHSFSITVKENGIQVTWLGESQKIEFTHSFHDTGQFYSRITPVNQGLLKACNNKQRTIRTLLDLTGGWGLDSFILAQHGKQVTMLEQNKQLHSIISHSLNNASQYSHTAGAASRIKLIQTNSAVFLRELNNTRSFDCIYLDPMFPEHKSGAKPGKEMQILQKLTANLDIEDCFEAALASAIKRVVVKRPAKSPALADRKPDMTYREKTIRFDVYFTA